MSVATEIERIQTAKETLKTKLNAKNDSEHQITDELISDYGNFVDSITGGDNIYDYFNQDIIYNYKIIQNIKKIPPLTFKNPSFYSMFSDMYRLVEVDFNNFDITGNVTQMDYCFNNCTNLKTINFNGFDSSHVISTANMLNQCLSLKSINGLLQGDSMTGEFGASGLIALITFSGVQNYGKGFTTSTTENSRSFTVNGSNNLSHDSLVSIIDNLYDLATAGLASQKLVLGETNLAKLTDEEKAVATTKGWNLS